MGMVIDLIVIGIIALFTFLGYKQGLVKAAIKILSFLIAIVVAFILYKPISKRNFQFEVIKDEAGIISCFVF